MNENQETAAPQAVSHKSLKAAKLGVQGELKAIVKGSKVHAGNFEYDYADLAQVLDYIYPILTRHGLLVETFYVEKEVWNERTKVDGSATITDKSFVFTKVGIRVLLTHVDTNEEQEHTIFDDKAPANIKERGGQITYLRRYGVQSLLGLAAEDDDAGSGGKKKPTHGASPDPERKPEGQKQPPKPAPQKPAAASQKPADGPPKKTDAEIEAEFNELGLNSKEAKEALQSIGVDKMQPAIVFRKKFQTTAEMIEGITGAQNGH